MAKKPARATKSVARTVGYSGTPLAKKLGYKPGTVAVVTNAPGTYMKLLAPLPEGVTIRSKAAASAQRAESNKAQADLIHAFITTRGKLLKAIKAGAPRIHPDGALWISWPKKASGVKTDVTEDVVRAEALRAGLVDIKVCAVDETWSGLKLVVPVGNRGGPPRKVR